MLIAGRVRSKPDPRTLHMSQISKLPPPPVEYHAAEVLRWPTLGNDKEPCCTCAAAAHMIHNWTAAHRAPVLLSEAQVLAAFVQVGGVDGAEMLQVLRFWRRSGIADRRLHAYVALNPQDARDLQVTIYLFGAAYIGLNFPDFAVREVLLNKDWVVPGGGAVGENAPREGNGHTVAAVGYDQEHLYVISCGVRRSMTWNFYRAYSDEAYAVLSPEWYGEERKSPNGFDLLELEREITTLREQATSA